MTRNERRSRTDAVISRRMRVLANKSALTQYQRLVGHRLHKCDALGACGNKHCSICAITRAQKKLEKRRVRYQARTQTHDD